MSFSEAPTPPTPPLDRRSAPAGPPPGRDDDDPSSLGAAERLADAAEAGDLDAARDALSALNGEDATSAADVRAALNLALLRACKRGRAKMAAWLIERGANPNHRHSLGASIYGPEHDTPLLRALESHDPDTLRVLAKRGAKVNADALAAEAAARGDWDTLCLLRDAGLDASAALRSAFLHGRAELARLLLAKEFPGIRERGAETLFAAAGQNDADMIAALVENGVDPRASRSLALRLAAFQGHREAAEALLDRGADPRAVESDALRAAARRGHARVVQLLLERGADPSARNAEALRLAREGGHDEAEALIEFALRD